MKKKKALSIVLAFAMIFAALTGTLTITADVNNGTPEDYGVTTLPAELPEEETVEKKAYFISKTGTVVEILEMSALGTPDDPQHFRGFSIELEGEEGGTFFFNTSDDRTVFPFDSADEIEEGDVITGFIPAGMPMITIYPPQYSPLVVIAGMPAGQNVQADRFAVWENEDFPFLAYGGMFAFAIGEDTEVVNAYGEEFEFFNEPEEDLNNRRMVVVYSVMTMSIPAFTTANKVIVLFEDAVQPGPADISAEIPLDVADWPIVVDGEYIEAPSAFMADDGVTIMVPLRAIAEALDFEVTWFAEDWAVELQGGGPSQIWARLVIGEIEVEQTFARRAPITFELPVAPVIVDGRTYVPLTYFFQNVLEMPNAFAFEGRLEIQSEGERML